MPVKGIKEAKKGIKDKFEKIRNDASQKAVYVICSQGAAMAQTFTPIDTSNLINSQTDPQISTNSGGVKGRILYTAEYAAAVHGIKDPSSGVERPGGNGEYWDPAGEPGFLTKGFEEIKPAIPAILREIYKDD